MTAPLARLAARAGTDPFFVAHALARSGQTPDQLAARLGITPDTLPRLALCRRPLPGARFADAVAAIARLAGGLPAFGIVAAVLGVVNTMGSVGQPPAVLGGMIGSALVGTFLGVLLAYGIVSPLASRLKQVIDADAAIYHVVKQIIIASLHGHPQPLVIEAARSGIKHKNQPGFAEVFDGLRGR